MSSANKFEHGDLEQEFRRRMHDAEASPAPDLWSRIDHDLTVQENKQYKERLVVYRQLAAACFVLFVLAGSLLGINYSGGFSDDDAAEQAPAYATQETDASRSRQRVNVEEGAAVGASVAPLSSRETQETTAATAVAPGKTSAIARSGRPAGAADHMSAVAATPSVATTAPKAPGQVQATAAAPEDAAASLPPTLRLAVAGVPAASEKQEAKEAMKNTFPVLEELPNSITRLNEMLGKGAQPLERQSQPLALARLDESDAKGKDAATGADGRWSVGMRYMPSYFNQNIGLADNMMYASSRNSFDAEAPKASLQTATNMEAAQEEYAQNTTPAFSYTAEVKAGFKLSKKLKILSGLGYSQNTARTSSSYVVQQFSNNRYNVGSYNAAPSTIFVPLLSSSLRTDSISVQKTSAFDTEYRYRHVSVPIGLQYEGAISKAWYWYATGGVATNILLQSTIMASNNQVQSQNYSYRDEASPFQRVQLSGNVGLGVGKRITESVAVAVGPEFRSFFTPLLADPENTSLAPQGKPYAVGVNVGVNYTLGTGGK